MIRRMCAEDLPSVLALEQESFTSPWPEREFLYELKENPFSNLLVAEQDGEIVGYCDWWILYEQAQVANLAVRKSCRHAGIGSALMHEMVRDAIAKGCENLSLEVRVSNAPAVALYEKYGFIRAGIRKAYYEDPTEDAILMVKPLGGLENDEDTGN